MSDRNIQMLNAHLSLLKGVVSDFEYQWLYNAIQSLSGSYSKEKHDLLLRALTDDRYIDIAMARWGKLDH